MSLELVSTVPRISVVIPTYRRPDLLQRCLAAVLAQTVAPHAYEVIVVDDAPTEDTRALVQNLQRMSSVRLVYLTAPRTQGPAGARNVGWHAAMAPLVAFTDDDTSPDAAWLEEAMAALDEHPEWCAASGRVVVPAPVRPTDHERNTKGLETAGFVTANCIVRRKALAGIGGFDERYRRAWREDSDLYFRLLDRVGPVGHAAHAVVLHPVRSAPWGVSLSQQANVYFDALLYREHPWHYRRSIRPSPPWNYYVIVGASLASVVTAALGAWVWASVLALAAVGGIALFAARRLRGASHRLSHVAEMLVTSAAIPFLSMYWRVRGAIRFRVMFL